MFEYQGFTVHRLDLFWYFIIGPDFLGYATSEKAAWKMIDGIITGRCE